MALRVWKLGVPLPFATFDSNGIGLEWNLGLLLPVDLTSFVPSNLQFCVTLTPTAPWPLFVVLFEQLDERSFFCVV